jgi:hypothetical protein
MPTPIAHATNSYVAITGATLKFHALFLWQVVIKIFRSATYVCTQSNLTAAVEVLFIADNCPIIYNN